MVQSRSQSDMPLCGDEMNCQQPCKSSLLHEQATSPWSQISMAVQANEASHGFLSIDAKRAWKPVNEAKTVVVGLPVAGL